jgi:alkaline phosphatase D
LRPEGDQSAAGETVTARLEDATHRRALFQLEGLKPRTAYRFDIRSASSNVPLAFGSFTTAPGAGDPAQFRVAIASCFGGQYRRENGRTVEKRGIISDSWKLLSAEEPDLQLIIGDNVYADSTDYNHLWDSYTLERLDNRPFAAAIRSVPTYAVWDDHDFGPNNSDGTAAGKEHSLRAFSEVYANPYYGTEGTPGIFSHFQWGDVEFYLLDGRYHRSPDDAPNDDAKRFLGDGQFEWLVDRLKTSDATFKVLACGSTWRASRGDGWRIYDFARRRLLQAIVDHKIGGVVFTSGDVHWCDIQVHEPEVSRQYPLVEIISSGLGSHGEDDKHAFAVVDFDTTKEDPELMIRIIEEDGREVQRRLVRRSQLEVRD